jgi:hypothetical protein
VQRRQALHEVDIDSRPRRPAHSQIGRTAMCPHTPSCPPVSASHAASARIVSDHLQDSGYALLCNGAVLLEGDDLLVFPQPRRAQRTVSAA